MVMFKIANDHSIMILGSSMFSSYNSLDGLRKVIRDLSQRVLWFHAVPFNYFQMVM